MIDDEEIFVFEFLSKCWDMLKIWRSKFQSFNSIIDVSYK